MSNFLIHSAVARYRGFGDCPGKPSEAGLALDAHAAWNWVNRRWPEMVFVRIIAVYGHFCRCGQVSRRISAGCKVFLYGQSLGTAVAVRLAHDLVAHEEHSALVTLFILSMGVFVSLAPG